MKVYNLVTYCYNKIPTLMNLFLCNEFTYGLHDLGDRPSLKDHINEVKFEDATVM